MEKIRMFFGHLSDVTNEINHFIEDNQKYDFYGIDKIDDQGYVLHYRTEMESGGN